MRGRAAAVGGTLTIRSAPGAGTTVRLALPLHRHPAPRAAPGTPGVHGAAPPGGDRWLTR